MTLRSEECRTDDVVAAVVGGRVAEASGAGVEAGGQAAVYVSAMERVVLRGQGQWLPLLQEEEEDDEEEEGGTGESERERERASERRGEGGTHTHTHTG